LGFGAHGLVAELVAGSVHAFSTARVQRALHAFMAGTWLFFPRAPAVGGGPRPPPLLAGGRPNAEGDTRAPPAPPPRAPRPPPALLRRRLFLSLTHIPTLLPRSPASSACKPANAPPPMWPVIGASMLPVHLPRPAGNTLVLEPEGGYLLEPTSLLVRKPNE